MRGISERVQSQCHLIAESARVVTGAPRAILLLYDETTRRLVTVATPGSEMPLQVIAVDLIRRNYPGLDPLDLTYRPTINPHVREAFVGQRTQVSTYEEGFKNLCPAPVAAIVRGLIGITHVVSVPVVGEGRALGLIRFLVGSLPSDAQQALMEGAAGQIGLTLANAELAEQTRRQLAATRAIGEVARLGASGGPSTTLEAVVKCVRELTEADAAIIFLTDPGGETFSLVAEDLSEEGQTADIARAGTPSRQVGQGLVGWVIAAGEAAFVPDLRRDPRTRTLHRSIPEAAIAVPMHLRGKTVGCLRLSLLGGRQFSEPDLWLAQTLADEAALAVQHARDLQRVHEEAREDGARAMADQAIREIGEPLRELLRQTGEVNGSPQAELRARLEAAHAAAQRIEGMAQRLKTETRGTGEPLANRTPTAEKGSH